MSCCSFSSNYSNCVRVRCVYHKMLEHILQFRMKSNSSHLNFVLLRRFQQKQKNSKLAIDRVFIVKVLRVDLFHRNRRKLFESTSSNLSLYWVEFNVKTVGCWIELIVQFNFLFFSFFLFLTFLMFYVNSFAFCTQPERVVKEKLNLETFNLTENRKKCTQKALDYFFKQR